jgi:4-hydroxy-tetrahydrodipicolinate reductase
MQGVTVLGANGRMGGSLVRLLAGGHSQQLAGAVTEPGHPCVGQDAGTAAGLPAAGVLLTDRLAEAVRAGDVVIDFTTPAAFAANLAACVAAGRPVVIGTTGLGEAEQALLADAARQIAIVYGRNMSLGVAVLGELVRLAAALLGPDYDIEITEAHHRHKKDAPSGTALELGEAAAAGRGEALSQVAVAGRHGPDCPRRPGEIGFAALRAGGIIGEHRVLFGSDEELVEIRHEALDRALFARGALRAAQWLAGRRPGLYAMRDVLGLPRPA